MNLPHCGWSVPERYVGSKHLVSHCFMAIFVWICLAPFPRLPLLSVHPTFCHYSTWNLRKLLHCRESHHYRRALNLLLAQHQFATRFVAPTSPSQLPRFNSFSVSLSLPVFLSFVSPASTAAVPNEPKPKLKLKQRHHPKELKVRAHWQLRPSAQKIYTPIPIYICMYVYTIYSKITDSKRQRAKCIKYPKRRETKATKSKAEVERVLHKFTFHVCSVAVERSCSRQNLTATWRLHFYISI